MLAKVVVVVKDPFMADLLTKEDAEILVRGTSRLFSSGVPKPHSDQLGLPASEWACVHVEVSYEQSPDNKGFSVPAYTRCTSSISDDGAYLCPYHERTLLTKKLTINELASINFNLKEKVTEGFTQRDHDIVEGILKADSRDIKTYPIKRLNGLRVSLCPTPQAKGEVAVDPSWEQVDVHQI
jgi:hypothetical protein